MRQTPVFGLSLYLTVSALSLLGSPVRGADSKTIWVAHRRVDCIGVAPQKCYLIKNTQYEDWRFWYGEIEGFEYEEGYAYELRVVEKEIDNPPADAPGIVLELVEVLLKVETFEGPAEDPAETPPTAAVPAPPAPPVEAPALKPAPAPAEPIESEPLELAPVGADPPVDAEPPAPAPPAEPVAAPPLPTSSSAKGEIHRGHLSIGSGVEARSFKLCGAEESIWVEDRTDGDVWTLYRRLSGYPNRPLFMEVRGEILAAPAGGFGTHYSQQILIHAVRNASAESAGCFAEPEPFAFRATGNEPFWNVEISKRGLVFSQMGEDRILFPYSQPTFFGEQIIYRSQVRGQEPKAFVVRLTEESCSDTMADATFSFKATVQIDDLSLEGCAREGEEQP